MSKSAAVLSPGVQIGHYTIESRIGAGGMGEVYCAFDTALERRVALKVLPPALLTDIERARRFVQEARSASALNHPNIVTIYQIGQDVIGGDESGEQARAHYIAMELIEGVTLRTVIADRTPLPRLLEILAQAADGLAKAHAAGIIHRDLKPDNIMVSNDGFAKIVDFGLAKLTEGATKGEPGLTQEGMVMGTVGYMSPEQIEGQTLDPRSDIFAFGCIIYEAATGRRPFQSDLAIDTLHKIVFAEPDPIDTLVPGSPHELQQLIDDCLRKNKDVRQASIVDVARRLRAIASGPASLSHAAPQAPSMPASDPAHVFSGPSRERSRDTGARGVYVPPARARRWTFRRVRSWAYRAVAIAAVLTGIWIWQTMPDFSALAAEPLQPWVSHDSIPSAVRQAVIEAKDPDFQRRLPRRVEHVRAIVTSSWNAREVPKIASPITAAAAHALYAPGSPNPLQNIRAWAIAVMMERELSRERILEIYLNTATFGEADGITRAADQYFSRRPGSLNRRQAAYIAALAATGSRVAPGEEDASVGDLQEQLISRLSEPAPAVSEKSSRETQPSKEPTKSERERAETAPEPEIPEPPAEAEPPLASKDVADDVTIESQPQ